jgi:hypothetical protein
VRYQGRCPPSALADSAVLLCSVVSSQSAFILCVRAAALQTTALSRNGARRGVPVELQPLFCLMSRRLRGRPAIHAMVPLSNAGNRGTSHRPIPPCTANLPPWPSGRTQPIGAAEGGTRFPCLGGRTPLTVSPVAVLSSCQTIPRFRRTSWRAR